ncbi:MAG: helix-turn-helix domain-containing protein [Bacteroidales bacterium]|nr:helix-turn-helix domain-containing protein [Bacteroidales bacterium]
MIQVINRALDILEYLSRDRDGERTLGQIAGKTGLNNATCANIIKTLVQRGYIQHLGPKRGYRLGIMPLILSDQDAYFDLLADACRIPIDSLCADINETVLLAVVRDCQRYRVYESHCTHELQVRARLEQPVYKATTGRMIIASYDAQALDRLIAQVGLPDGREWPEATTRAALEAELERIRTEGIAFSRNANDVVSIAVPIEIKGRVAASVGIYLPGIRYDRSDGAALAGKLRDCARAITGTQQFTDLPFG